MAFPSDLIRTKNWGTETLFDTILEGQFDLIISYVLAALHSSSGHAHTGASNQGPKISLTAGVSGALPIANGGTGAVNLGNIYPVGCIYTTTVATNPATVFGFGTWAAFGGGRVLVGLDAAQTEFDTVEETGGAKTHTLTTGEMPAHTHSYSDNSSLVAGSDPGAGATQETESKTTGSTGGGGAHNNLQPYICVYFWKRVS